MTSNQITLSPLGIARKLGKITFFLVIAGTAGQLFKIFTGHGRLWGFVPLFNLDGENNFPSYFSMFILQSASALLTIITILEKKRATAYTSHWAVLAFGFLCMSIDEICSFHESLSTPTRAFFGNHLPSAFHWAWVIPGMALVICLALYFFKFLLHLSVHARRTFMLSGSIYLAGAIGMELIGGHYAELYGDLSLNYLTSVVIEESFEMIGVIIFIWGLLEYIGDNFTEIQFKIEKN